MQKFHYDIIFWIGFTVWLGGSWYFGWNAKAETNGEGYTDTIGLILMAHGFLNSLVRGIKTDVVVNINEKNEQ